jgi:hypothetical protein
MKEIPGKFVHWCKIQKRPCKSGEITGITVCTGDISRNGKDEIKNCVQGKKNS